jgi:hypothetical protein
MKIAAMQPYFLPYLGYFSLIKHTDRFVINGVVQFRKHSWINRNRILNPSDGWNYFTIPLAKHSYHASINEIQIHNGLNWKAKIIAQLEHYKKIAPHFRVVKQLVQEILNTDTQSLLEINVHSLKIICQYLHISFQPIFFSELNIPFEDIHSPDEWGLETAKALKADTYWNLPGGKSFYDAQKYERNNIRLCFLTNNLKPYNQKRIPFIPALSIIDVMMFNPLEAIHQMLDDYHLESVCDEIPNTKKAR